MSFLKELAKLAEPAPSLPDLEDETIEDNKVSQSKFDEGDDEGPVRRRIIGSQLQDDERYAGKKVKRCDIFGTNDVSDDEFEEDFADDEESSMAEKPTQVDSSEEEADDEEDDADEEEDDADKEEDEEGSISEGELQKAMENGDEDGLSEEQSVADESEEEDEASDMDQTTNDMKNIMLDVDKDKESKKAISVREQLKTWDQLLFLKIKLQAASRAYNRLPRGHLAKELMKNCDEETRKNMLLARKNAKELVELLLAAEKALLGSSPLTQSIVGIEGGMVDSDDEEIESSEDEVEEDEVGEDEDDLDEEEAPKEKTSMGWKAQEKQLKENETKFDKFRSSTLVKWDERTKLTGPRRAKDARKDFSAFEQGSVVQQIDKIMADKVRILKRSQTKRSDHDRIGADPEADVDEEIFDDDDFYQVLLKEMIDKKTSASQDPIAMTRSFIEMQNLRNKRSKKRVFDNKLSKDRKVKYVPIPKLVNFHPARPELITWTHESRNELFKSLFK